MTTFAIPCNASLMPTKAELVTIFKQLANIPSLLTVEVEKLRREAEFAISEEIRQQILAKIAPLEAQIEKVLGTIEQIKGILGGFPIFPSLSIPDIEWEKRITELIQNFHGYVMAKIIDLINAILPINFVINILGLSIDIVRVFTDPDYRSQLVAQVVSKISSLFALLPDIYQVYEGIKYGVYSLEMQARAVWSYIMGQLQNGAVTLIYNALAGLIKKFKTIWDALHLPALIDLLTLDVPGIIQGLIGDLIEKIKNAPEALKNAIRREIIDKLKSISLAGFNLLQIIGGEISSFVDSIETQIERFMEALRDFGEQWPMYLIKLWMNKITAFLNAIGLGALLEWITFDFCKFLKLIGMPTSISVDVDIALDFSTPIPSVGVETYYAEET
jgi:hypothetical protein